MRLPRGSQQCIKVEGPARCTGESVRGQHGQTMVELALVAPVLLLICMIMVDFSRAIASTVAASSAARQAAVYASHNYINPISCLRAAAQQLVVSESGGTLTLDDVQPGTPTYPNERDVRATVAAPFSPITPIIGKLTGGLVIYQSVAIHARPNPIISPTIGSTVSNTPNDPDRGSPPVQTSSDPDVPSLQVDNLSWSWGPPRQGYQITYNGQTFSPGGFIIYRNGCPVDYRTMDASVTSYTQTEPHLATATYSVMAVSAHPDGFAGLSSNMITLGVSDNS